MMWLRFEVWLSVMILVIRTGSGRMQSRLRPEALSHHQPILFETHRAPLTFTKLSISPPSHHTLDLRIGLKTPLDDQIEDLLLKISDPLHSSYRQHLTHQQSQALSKPTSLSLLAVEDWLSDHGFGDQETRWSSSKDWVTVLNVPLQKVEEMLKTRYSVYQHLDGEHVIRTESFSLPGHLHQHIDVVQVSFYLQLHINKM